MNLTEGLGVEMFLVPGNVDPCLFKNDYRSWELQDSVSPDYFNAFLEYVQNPSVPWDQVVVCRPRVEFHYLHQYTMTVDSGAGAVYTDRQVRALGKLASPVRDHVVVVREFVESAKTPMIGVIPDSTTISQVWLFRRGDWTIQLRQYARGKTKQAACETKETRFEIKLSGTVTNSQVTETLLLDLASKFLCGFEDGKPVSLGLNYVRVE